MCPPLSPLSFSLTALWRIDIKLNFKAPQILYVDAKWPQIKSLQPTEAAVLSCIGSRNTTTTTAIIQARTKAAVATACATNNNIGRRSVPLCKCHNSSKTTTSQKVQCGK